jgi:nickel-type superoxide dismutase maturation protease
MTSPKYSGRQRKPRLFIVRRTVGKSMMPTLRPGTIVIAHARPKCIAPGDVVVVRHDGLDKIKRVKQISERGLFVVGDNPRLSTDSRDFGWLDHSAVAGKVWWPRTAEPDLAD